MKQTVLLASIALLGLGGITYALLVLATDVRHVSSDLEVLTRDVNSVSRSVDSLANDVSDIADALAGEADSDEAEQSARSTRWHRRPQSRLHAVTLRSRAR